MAIDAVAKRWATIGGALNAAVEVAHHIRKPAAGTVANATDDDARGGSALKAATRATRVVNGMSATEAKAFGVPEDKAGFYYRVDRGTTNMQGATKWSKWFKFESIDFDNATPEYPSDNVGVSTAWTPPDAFERLDPEEQEAVLKAIKEETGELRVDGRSARGT